MSKSANVTKVEKNTNKMKALGFVKIHTFVPESKREEVLAYCRQVREDYFKVKDEL